MIPLKINGIQRIGAANPYAKHEARPTDIKGKREMQKDAVQISPEAQELLDAKGTAEAALRSQKLDHLKQSVSTGTYYVEAGHIAEKLFPFIK
ncbi:flagellar biosynthesis anti-sigma factor FlgM [Paenibacillus sp. GYB004]|uniref:flagellar biosynthesis anti-sigma factor FlgM n=1 Tax=Paenibacillus sp. GYB004 TaxID=2994393 RepID=UPI002F964A1D